MKAMLVAVLLLGLLLVPAGAWERFYGGVGFDQAECVIITPDDGYIVVGFSDSYLAGGYDALIFKLNQEGDTVWLRNFGGSGDDILYSAALTLDGGYVTAGKTRSFGAGSYDAWVIKLNIDGDTLWTHTYGGSSSDGAYSIALAPDGGYIVAGFTQSFASGGCDAWVLKLDERGSTVWTYIYGGPTIDEALSVFPTLYGGYIVAGYSMLPSWISSYSWVVKLDEYGDTLWCRTYREDTDSRANCIVPTHDGGYLIGGHIIENHLGAWVLKINECGDTLWSRVFGQGSLFFAYSLAITADNDIFAAGEMDLFSAGAQNVLVFKLNSSGDTIWTHNYGGTGTDIGLSIAAIGDGGCIVGGYTSSIGTGGDAYIITLDSLGNSSAVESGPQPSLETSRLSASHHADKLDLRITLPQSAHVRLDLVNLAGETIATVLDRAMPSGESRIEVPCPKLAAGVYMLRSDGTLPGAQVVVW